MLDFQKLVPQLVALAQESSAEDNPQTRILSLAQASFEEVSVSWQQYEQVIQDNRGETFWPLAVALEPFGQHAQIAGLSEAHSVVACDGSQIMPTQHEVHSCFLLNVGAAVFHYAAENSRASLNSYPYLYHRQEDLYPLINQRRYHIDEALVSFERNQKELEQAFVLARAENEAGHRVLTLVDGSLIPFNVDRSVDRLQRDLLERFELCLERFRQERLPLVGYISHSRASDVVNTLRVWRCPYPQSRCQLYCGSSNEEDFPCSQIWPLSDRQLFASKLPKRARSNFFQSGSRWSGALSAPNQICFAYLNVGSEACRLEIPGWLFQDRELLDFALQAVLLQSLKGQGYPISLAEAHNMAVVRQTDRSRFYQLLAEQLLLEKQAGVAVSPKEMRKRRGIV